MYKILEPAEHFYVVWCEGTSQVVKQHAYFGAATKEAKRLAKKFPLKKFYVLKACVSVLEPPTEDSTVSINELISLPDEVVAQLSKKLQALIRKLRAEVKGAADGIQVS